ncbi:COP9 signalosome complex subunit 4-like [Halichondria panicea]|uniref:COP9 signalosome complex subunit 4-like n=1 Tax=Halichondria panicea TaxID=6063 RepID=UPI00312B495E
MTFFCEKIPELEKSVAKPMCLFTLSKMQSRSVSFEEQATQVRLSLSKILEAEQNWTESAELLCAIPMDSGQKIYPSDFKMEVYLRIAQLYLEEQNHVAAEAYINRAALLQSEVDRNDLHIIYKPISDVHVSSTMLLGATSICLMSLPFTPVRGCSHCAVPLYVPYSPKQDNNTQLD